MTTTFFQTFKYLFKCLQELSNTNFNRKVDSGSPAPDSPSSFVPFYRVHGSNRSPRPISPESPRPQFTIPLNQTDGPMRLPAGGPRMNLEPHLLVNKAPDELPPGVDPCQREVGAKTTRSLYQFTGGKIYINSFIEKITQNTTGETHVEVK